MSKTTQDDTDDTEEDSNDNNHRARRNSKTGEQTNLRSSRGINRTISVFAVILGIIFGIALEILAEVTIFLPIIIGGVFIFLSILPSLPALLGDRSWKGSVADLPLEMGVAAFAAWSSVNVDTIYILQFGAFIGALYMILQLYRAKIAFNN